MQQASGSIVNYPAPPGNFLPPAAAGPRFVVNLCASTTPVGLVQPTHAGLKRFTFFVSRRLEEGRERFRLHMGYFDTQEEAEKILDLVRDVYPGAWAGAAPGIRLRARAAAAAAEAAPAAERAVERASEPQAVAAPASVSAPVAAPVLSSAPPAAIAPAVVVTAAPAPIAAPVAQPVQPATVIQLELVPDRPRAIPAPIVEFEPAKDKDNAAAAARSLNDVRAAINSLDEVSAASSGVHTTIAPTVAMPAIVPTILRTAPPAALKAPVPVQAPVKAAVKAADSTLEGPAVLRLLETARPATAAKPRPIYAQVGAPRQPVAAAPTPTAPRAEPALFAVQLLWSVQSIDMTKIPQLAIFSAYTLYGAEGNRDGRRWYGLRLGFFTDAVSAKQVAQYVRSEFTSVSVVPVSVRERARAGAATSKPLPSLSTAKNPGPELNFIEEVQTDTATSGSRPALQVNEEPKQAQPEKAQPELSPALRAAIAAVGVSRRAAPGGKRVKLRVGQGMKPVSKRPQKRALSLEETLEILGASELQVDNGRGELINDSSRRSAKRAPPATPSGSRFGRLINRLAERLGNS